MLYFFVFIRFLKVLLLVCTCGRLRCGCPQTTSCSTQPGPGPPSPPSSPSSSSPLSTSSSGGSCSRPRRWRGGSTGARGSRGRIRRRKPTFPAQPSSSAPSPCSSSATPRGNSPLSSHLSPLTPPLTSPHLLYSAGWFLVFMRPGLSNPFWSANRRTW